MDAHIELIQPYEKVSPEFGGTGYLPPAKAATDLELAEAIRTGQIIWKVARISVNWKRFAKSRRLKIGRLRVTCKAIGGQGEWWFVLFLG